ncbi:MAG TPA: SGNH/GDSL hydrolase family protein [Gemmatimonadaceae bacterium]|nr:SGNH/GDSL hydrolase family protein [Gemmatimonadaceae bacterium]
MRFLALGDSYTIGEGVAAAERWPNQLVELLRARGIAMSDPELIARTAWTTDELMDAIDEARPTGPFDLVTLLIGVNDQYRSRPIDHFESGFGPVLDQAIGFARGGAARLIVVSIPDWGATPFAEGRDRALITREVGDYNAAARALTAQRGAHWHDVTESSRRMLEDPSLVVSDGLHPSGAMYARWAASMVPVAEKILGRSADATARA